VTAQYATCGNKPAGAPATIEVGAKQTPINIESSKAISAALPELAFEYENTPFEVENTGHVVEVPYEEGSTVHLGQSVTDTYELAQFHFHAPSEHTIDGKTFDAEAHLVHRNILGEVVVVGVLLTKSEATEGNVFDEIVRAAPLAEGSAAVEGVSLNALALLPDERSYFTYTGSLTTPPCTESVRWFVMQKPVPVSSFVIQQLHTVAGLFPGYNGYPNNNRPVVPLNGRTVLSGK